MPRMSEEKKKKSAGEKRPVAPGKAAVAPAEDRSSRRPIMGLLEVLGRRWVLRILWELRASTLSFRALQSAASDVSPSVLNERLAELREAGLVELTPQGYALTGRARELAPTLIELDAWARRHRFGAGGPRPR